MAASPGAGQRTTRTSAPELLRLIGAPNELLDAKFKARFGLNDKAVHERQAKCVPAGATQFNFGIPCRAPNPDVPWVWLAFRFRGEWHDKCRHHPAIDQANVLLDARTVIAAIDRET